MSYYMVVFYLIILNISFLLAEIPSATLTIPKSGTNLIEKTMKRLYQADFFSFYKTPKEKHDYLYRRFAPECNFKLNEFENYLSENMPFITHFNHIHIVEEFLKTHTQYKSIIHIRDPRAICASQARAFGSHDQKLTKSKYQQLLKEAITRECDKKRGKESVWDIELNILAAMRWMQNPEVLVVRYEDLVGSKGGGSDEKQKQIICALANHIGISLSDKELQAVQKDLWGDSATFKIGKIDQFRKDFSDENKKLFNRILGKYMEPLGYSTKTTW